MVTVCRNLHACTCSKKIISLPRVHNVCYLNHVKQCIQNYCIPSSERVSRVLLMLGDEQREVASMGEGNIAVAVGMKNVSSISAW